MEIESPSQDGRVDALRASVLGEAPLVLLAHPRADGAVVRLRDLAQHAHRVEEAREQRDGPARTEHQAPGDVAHEAAVLVAVLLHPGCAPDDVAEERVAERLEHAT